MKVRVTVDAVVLDGLRVHPRERAALLARLETRIGAQLATLPAQVWTAPADALTAPIQAAVTSALPRPGGRS
jgi:hypothetical protein